MWARIFICASIWTQASTARIDVRSRQVFFVIRFFIKSTPKSRSYPLHRRESKKVLVCQCLLPVFLLVVYSVVEHCICFLFLPAILVRYMKFVYEMDAYVYSQQTWVALFCNHITADMPSLLSSAFLQCVIGASVIFSWRDASGAQHPYVPEKVCTDLVLPAGISNCSR